MRMEDNIRPYFTFSGKCVIIYLTRTSNTIKDGGIVANEAKNIISRESCQKDLNRTVKADMYSNSVLLAVMLLIFVPLIIISIYISKYVFLLGIIFALLCTVAPIVFIYKLIRCVMLMRLVARDGFSVVRDTVSRLSKGEIPKSHTEGRHTVNVIYFTKHGRYIAQKNEFALSSVGDEFYLVILHTKKEKIAFAFHSMMHEYKEV